MNGVSKTLKPLYTEKRFLAICRRGGVSAVFEKADGSEVSEFSGIYDEVDSEVSLSTGLAAGTPVFESLSCWVGERFINGDFLTIDQTRFMIRGAPMVDTTAGTVMYALTRRAA